MDPTDTVIEGLQRSSKGCLNYQYKLRNQEIGKRIAILDGCNSLPQFSPEIKNLLHEKDTKHSTSTVSTEDVDFEPAAETVPADFSTQQDQSIVGETVSADFSTQQDQSVVGELNRELEECEVMLDDRLLADSAAAVELNRRTFQQKLQEMNKHHHERLELVGKSMHRQFVHEQERRRLDEMGMSLAIENWRHNVLQEYRAEEEKLEAMLLDGEQRAKRILVLKEEAKKEKCRHYQAECQVIGQEWAAILQSCQYPQALSVANEYKAATDVLASIVNQLSALERSGPIINETEIDVQRDKLQDLKFLSDFLKKAVQEADLSGREQAAKEQQIALKKALLEKEEQNKLLMQQNLSQQKQDLSQQKQEQKSLQKTKDDHQPRAGNDSTNTLGMPKSVVAEYTRLQEMLSTTSSSTNTLLGSKDPTTKKYRFELQKAINITINSISANSGEGLSEKIARLRNLFGGQSVDVMGKFVSVSQHPEARLYCCNLLARKLVKQGEDQVSSNIEAAFPLAAVAIGLWSKYPEIGEHILAHFHSTCPILVPLYIQRSNDMTEADYMKLQGYKVSSDGVVETEDMFLHRIRGIVRLYAAIVSSPQLPVEQHLHKHPYGLEHGWAWLSRVLNMKPHPTLTAAAMGDLLEVAGHALMKKYKKQFRKLLQILYTEFVPRINECTPASQRGPIERLTQLLEDCKRSGTFSEPKGYLHTEFWRTKSRGIALA